MPGTIEIIPSRFWYNKHTQRKASIYGAVPYTTEAEKPDWGIVERGYTWRVTNFDGSYQVGLGRTPAKSYEEAFEVAKKAFGGKYTIIHTQTKEGQP